MLGFFKYPANARKNVNIKIADMAYISRVVNENISKTKMFYRNNDIQVNRNIYLVKMLNFLAGKVTLSKFDYFLHVRDTLESLYKSYYILNESDTNIVLDNQLFSNSLEVFLPIEDNTFITKSDEEIMEMMPIRPVYLENDRLEYELYNAEYNLNGKLCVMEINVVLLAMMWYIYLKQGNTNTPFSFLNGYVYPNMLNQFINLTILGRVRSYYYQGKKPKMLKQNYTRYVKTVDIQDRLDGSIRTYLKLFYNGNFPLQTFIGNVPYINYDLIDTMKINFFTPLTQMRWIQWLCVVPYARFLLDLMGERGRAMNRDRILNTGYDIRLLRTGNFNMWKVKAPPGLVDSLKEDLVYIIDNYMFDQIKSTLSNRKI